VRTGAIANKIDQIGLLPGKFGLFFFLEVMDDLLQSAAIVKKSDSQDEEAASIDEAYHSVEGAQPWVLLNDVLTWLSIGPICEAKGKDGDDV